MLIVKVNEPKQLDRALKVLKTKVSRTGIMSEIKERMEYKKPSVRKREQKLKAIYIQKKRNEE